MKSAPLPALPILFCLIGAGLLTASLVLRLQPASPTDLVLPDVQAMPTAAAVAPLEYHGSQIVSASAAGIQQSSPFATDRSPYSRTVARAAPVRKQTYNPQFVGTLGKGPSIRALIIWTPGQQPQSVSIGDETHWGTLISATASSLEFEGPDGKKTLSMF